MNDIPNRLRENGPSSGFGLLMDEAADFIESQTKIVLAYIDQHARDSAELRRLCYERDKARERVQALEAKCALLAASLAQSEREVDSLKHDIERHIANHAADLNAAVPIAPAVDAWQPIETAPRDGTNILIRFGSDGVSQAKYVPGTPHPWKFIDTNDGITWIINHAVDTEYGPTHWLPIPLPPAALSQHTGKNP